MKICWDNLEGLKYIGEGIWKKDKTKYFYNICEGCNEPFLYAYNSKGKYCCNKCSLYNTGKGNRGTKLIEVLNNVLKSYEQKIRIIKYCTSEVILSNGLILKNKHDIKRLYRRLHLKEERYTLNFDIMYSSIEKLKAMENEIRRNIASMGGKKAQELYGNKYLCHHLPAIPWNKGKKGVCVAWNKGLTKDTCESLKKLSIDRVGSGNPMYGKHHTEECKQRASDHIKKLIKEGKFTPNIHNSNTHWQSTVDNKKYRSSWEAAYHILNPQCKYESIRIEYIFDNKRRIYIVDFEDIINKKLIEIKPLSHKDSRKMLSKILYTELWCKKHNYSFEIIDESYFINRIDDIDFSKMDKNSEKCLRGLYEAYKKKKNRKTK